MEIYHYTSIETLALILKYKTIRFNRLDMVDDIEEVEYGASSSFIKTGQYNFVSCWTKEKEENIGLWGLYTNYKGVRISMDENMFITYPINGDNESRSFYPDFKCGNDCVISQVDSLSKLWDVRYVENLEKTIMEHGVMLYKDATDTHIPFMISPFIGTFKRTHWSHQKESRFKISAVPVVPGLANTPQDWHANHQQIYETTGDLMCDGIPISLEYIDVNLNTQAYSNMEIMLGPLTNDADKILVDSLINTYCHTATVKASSLKGKIRKKQ